MSEKRALFACLASLTLSGCDGAAHQGIRVIDTSCPPGQFGADCESTCTCQNDGICDDGVEGTGACACPSATVGPTCDAIPKLGVYRVHTDGSGLQLLVDPGATELSHVRHLPGTDWLTATRYHADPDGNGLAMENEEGFGAYYEGTEVVVFTLTNPKDVAVVAGTASGGMTANPSWTDDGRLIFIAAPTGPASAQIKRATFSTVPFVQSVSAIQLPSELAVPVDPHQVGPSDNTGKIVLSALFQLPGYGLWMRPVWLLPASGAASMASVSLVGCPICPDQVPAGCCGFATVEDVLGTNDARINHAATKVFWMQQSPLVSATYGPLTFNPYRQSVRTFASSSQVDLPAEGVADTTTLTFAEWRADDQELVYWAHELEGSRPRMNVYVMTSNFEVRTRVPLPRELCPLHPTYLDTDTIVFNAWRCTGAACTCDLPTP
ncbi:MAG: hypothetical protein ACAI38_00755 [Myxococcota bacterium]